MLSLVLFGNRETTYLNRWITIEMLFMGQPSHGIYGM